MSSGPDRQTIPPAKGNAGNPVTTLEGKIRLFSMLSGIQGERRQRLLTGLLCAGIVFLAWFFRFSQDDAFISFRYADNLAHGHGLVWNEGERVEGYTNFLWTMLVAAGIRLGFDPVFWSQAIGLLCFAASLYFSWKLGSNLLPSQGAATLFVVLLGANYTFLSFATGGLETSLQTALVLALTLTVLRARQSFPPSWRAVVLTGLIGSAAILTRLDSVMFCLLLEGYLIVFLLRSQLPASMRTRLLLVLLGAHLAILGPWMLWKLWYYGQLLPNTFYLKAATTLLAHMGHGVRYLWTFIHSYWLLPVLALSVWGLMRSWRDLSRDMLLLIAAVLLWVSYLVAVGGDFMEFRMLVPSLPFLFLILTAGIWNLSRIGMLRAACAVLLLVGTVHHGLTFGYNRETGIEPVPQLAGHLVREDENWIQIGRTLDSLFAPAHNVRIATTAAGAIPFYSHLPTVDMLGVNDPWVALHGVAASEIPGHQRITPISYLLRRHVNLVFSHPMVLPTDARVWHRLYVPIDLEGDMLTVRVVELPLDAGHKVVAWYLYPDSAVEAVKRKCRWHEYRMAMR